MRILLINPRTGDDFFRNALQDLPFISKSMGKSRYAAFAPHALATVAALTPEGHEVEIHDEYVHGPAENAVAYDAYDIIGMTTMVNQMNRTLAVGRWLRKQAFQGLLVVGGAGTMNMPASYLELFDVVFYGEAELTWPTFLNDATRQRVKPVYQQISKPDMNHSPIPRWELLGDWVPNYGAVSVQTTRGCPFDCDFCDVIYIYGRRQRSKPVSQVLEEIRRLQALGAKLILLADDNFGCNRAYCKDLLRQLIPMNNAFPIPMGFMTQSDVTISEDDELLALMADCNFIQVLLGIESADPRALQTINKRQNLRVDLLAAIHKIQSYGLPVLGSFIVGMDADDDTAFGKAIAFVESAHIMDHACHPLMAPSGTKLWYRLKKEGRLVKLDQSGRDRLDIITNIVPKRMSRTTLMEGLADYADAVHQPAHFMKRAIGFIHGVKRKPKTGKFSLAAFWRFRKMMARLFRFYLFNVNREHRRAFFTIMRTAMVRAPYLMPKMAFIYTAFFISHKRAEITVKLAREHAQRERKHPELIQRIAPDLPIPASIRRNSDILCLAAFNKVRTKVAGREILYQVVVEALTDFTERFGAGMTHIDDIHASYLHACIDRVLAGREPLPSETAVESLPEDRPPAGFTRDIMDALDHALRSASALHVPPS